MDTVVVIPTYNEAERIESLLSEIVRLHPTFDILVVDDNSPDNTADIVDRASRRYANVRLLRRHCKTGLGKAYIEAFRDVLRQPSYQRIIQMDADFSHDPRYLASLINATETCDVSIGSRYIPGGKIMNWKMNRRILSFYANLFVRVWLGIKVRDCTSGFRCFRRPVLESIQLETIKSNGYFFQVEMLLRCWHKHYRCTEVPIAFVERQKGKTKLGLYEIGEAVLGVFVSRFLPRY